MPTYVTLFLAIVAEIAGTTALKSANGFTNPIPSAIVVIGYGVAFYFLSLTLRTMPVGIAYAVWSGVGIVLISAIGWVFFNQKLDLPGIFGLSLIVAGVLVVNLWSKTAVH